MSLEIDPAAHDPQCMLVTGAFLVSEHVPFSRLSRELAPERDAVVDLTLCRMVDSGALGMLLELRERFRAAGGHLSLRLVPGPVQDAIQLANFHLLFEVDVADAA